MCVYFYIRTYNCILLRTHRFRAHQAEFGRPANTRARKRILGRIGCNQRSTASASSAQQFTAQRRKANAHRGRDILHLQCLTTLPSESLYLETYPRSRLGKVRNLLAVRETSSPNVVVPPHPDKWNACLVT